MSKGKFEKLADGLVANGPVKIEDAPKRVRILHNKNYIVDTIEAKLVWEHPYYPYYYVPQSAITHASMKTISQHDGYKIVTASIGHVSVENVLVFESKDLKDLVRFEFSAMDRWFEEDEQIYVHPKDPYKRVDIRRSGRHIKVVIDGDTVAETSAPTLLFETSLRTRYYLPATCVDPNVLTPSDTVTSCPYKGDASYYNVTVKGNEIKDAIWYYKYPAPECLTITGLLCFYNEKVDIYVDGVKEDRKGKTGKQ